MKFAFIFILVDWAQVPDFGSVPFFEWLGKVLGTGKKGDSKDGGEPLSVSFNEPHGVYVHGSGTLYIVDSMNHRVFRWEK